ncbi:MAG: WhiB family transcriptional regulator [Actinomycetia bacterium]|nr:WhiB family transcriptional regulator [Actinomycetes bacterium]
MTGIRRTPWPSAYPQRPRPDAVTLIARILEGSVSLPDAACIDRPELFDIDADDEQHAEAVEVCHQCPALNACRAWANPRTVSGVVAGQRFTGPPKPRQRKVTA